MSNNEALGMCPSSNSSRVLTSSKKALSSLSKREELVLRLRFGLDDVLEGDKNIYIIEDTNKEINNGNA